MQPEVENPKWQHLDLTKQQWDSNGYTYVLGIQLSNGNSDNVVRPNGKKPEVEKPRWRYVSLEYVYFDQLAPLSQPIGCTHLHLHYIEHKMAMKFQRRYHSGIVAILYDRTAETGSGKSKMATCKLEIRITLIVHKKATKFQWQHPYFRGRATL